MIGCRVVFGNLDEIISFVRRAAIQNQLKIMEELWINGKLEYVGSDINGLQLLHGQSG